MPYGSISAEVAAMPSPLIHALPVPTIVLRIFVLLTLRIRLASLSAKYKLPYASKVQPRVKLVILDVAAKFSPLYPHEPVPA